MEQASEREAGQGGARSLLLHGHSSFTTFSVRFRDTAASETQQPRRHSSLGDTAASETQQPRRLSSGKSSTLFLSNLAHSKHPVTKGGAGVFRSC